MDRSLAIAAEIPRLRRYARALLSDASDADDLVQDCLLRALDRRASWTHGDSPRKWLFTILHNLHVDRLRRAARRPPHVPLEEGLAAGAAESEAGTARDISRALAMIPEDQKQAVLLVALEGMSYAETAEILGVPVGTVMSRLARGRERLRQILEGGGSAGHLKRVK